MRAYPLVILLVGFVGLAGMQPVAAQKAGCESMDPGAPAAISEQLDQAERELSKGDYESAAELAAMAGSIIRFGAGSQWVDFECVGNELRTRHFRIRQRAHLPLGKNAEESARQTATFRSGAINNYLFGRNLADVQRVLANPQNPKLGAAAGPQLRQLIEHMNQSVENGHGLIAEETEALAVYNDQLDRLIAASRAKAAALLKQEETAVTGPITETDEAIMDMADASEAVIGSFLGVDEEIMGDGESRPILLRANRSAEMLDRGRRWVDWIGPDAPAALKSRAQARGDAMLARADDTGNGLEARDSYYDVAIGYFKIAEATAKSAAAKASRDRIQPALGAERASRDQRLEQKAQELKKSAEEFKRSMEKTAEEQETFRDEADSLEAELGF